MRDHQAGAPENPWPEERTDLFGRIPTVFNGRSAEEWSAAFCQEAFRNDRLLKALTVVTTCGPTDAAKIATDAIGDDDRRRKERNRKIESAEGTER